MVTNVLQLLWLHQWSTSEPLKSLIEKAINGAMMLVIPHLINAPDFKASFKMSDLLNITLFTKESERLEDLSCFPKHWPFSHLRKIDT